jgi:plasmid stabilization system protein ParE
MTVRLHPEAELELQAAAQWYERRVAGLGERFLSEAIDGFISIEKHPHRFARSRYRTKREVRQRSLGHFPYRIVYEVRESECIVVAVAHASQRPAYWRERLD